MYKLLLLSLLPLAMLSVQAGELYRWTDAQGKVHFSDKPPKTGAGTAQRVEVNVPPVTEAQRQEAEARLAKLKAAARVAHGSGSVGMTPPDARAASDTGGTPCERAWREYNESLACFSAHRGGGGKVSAAGFEKCKNVVEPSACK
ncbi:MAG: hypothetical protein C4K60_14590 [Ideonella sp. MAG2]|nr:MAG: hypothetical protein C4K60_14590 [Ideonella sp. MAG2]